MFFIKFTIVFFAIILLAIYVAGAVKWYMRILHPTVFKKDPPSIATFNIILFLDAALWGLVYALA